MGITDVLALLGGLALFLYGMQMMSTGLEAAAGNRMKSILEKLTSNRVKGVLVGAAITAVIQSSSATTVMVVGFVNSGLMTLKQAVWMIMGANIGTTITGQLIALDIGAIAPLFAIAGVGAIMFIKSEKVHHISSIFAGLGILFMGMDMMGAAMSPLKESEAFISLMTKFDNPLLGILVGALFTAVIQSSSASVGILQALASTGMIPLSSAVFVLFGQNIGTCITAVLASIGMKVNAKRTTVIHLLFNIIGTVLFTVICLVTPYVTWIEAMTPGDPVAQIANAHTVFNIVTTLLLLPFGTHMANIAVRILPDSKKADDEDLRLKYIRPFESSYAIGHSAVAVSQVRDEVNRMRDMVAKNISDSFDSLVQYDEKLRKKVSEREEYIDFLNKGISEYIVSLMASEMNMSDSRKINGYYAIISNLERIGDHAVNLAEYGDDMRKWEIDFSDTVKEELNEMKAQCIAALDNLKEVTSENVERILSQAVIIEQKTDDMRDKYFKKQMQRLKKGKCKPQSGIVFSEILTDFERMGDHALNIAQQYREME
ncbi:Na/Pi cotransporter family protein [[Ruminococcus] torques]|uniref:Na/Pi cotransporter family protein n=1 Tax=[Ruminococcus] torques TaxID=33039 RepID=UPI003078D549